jgi:Zn-dependent protease with chaperone function
MTRPPDRDSVAARLNPFAFPSDTTFQFVLLTIGIAATLPFVWQYFWTWSNQGSAAGALATCTAQHPRPAPVSDPQQDLQSYLAHGQAVAHCLIPLWNRPSALFGGLGLAIGLAVATVLYWQAPYLLIRRRRLQPMDAATGDRLGIRWLSSSAGVEANFLLDPLASTSRAQAFGLPRRRMISLSTPLVMQSAADPDLVRGVVRHELAHLKNRDVDYTYLTVCLWWAFVVVGLVPFVGMLMTIVLTGAEAPVLAFSWRLLALTVLVLLVRNALLRTREAHADVRASIWDGLSGGLLRNLRQRESDYLRLRWLPVQISRRWVQPWLRHPSKVMRAAAVVDPALLLRFGFWESVATGLVTVLGFSALEEFLSDLGVGPVSWWSTLFYGPLVSGIIAIAIWRSVLAEQVSGSTAVVTPNRVGLGLGLGLAIGSVPLLESAHSNKTLMTLEGEPAHFSAVIVGGVLVLLGTWLLAWWLTVASRAWAPAAAGRPTPRPLTFVTFVVGSVVCGTAVNLLVDLQDTASFFGAPFPLELLLLVLAGPIASSEYASPMPAALALAFLLLLWVYPLIGHLLSSRAGPPAHWTLISGRAISADRKVAPVRIWPSLVFGAVVGAACMVTLSTTSEGVRHIEERLLLFVWIAQALAAAIATLRTPSLGFAHGLGAAFSTGVAACLLLPLVMHQKTGMVDFSSVTLVQLSDLVSHVVRAGATMAIPVVLIVTVLMVAVRAIRSWLVGADRRGPEHSQEVAAGAASR